MLYLFGAKKMQTSAKKACFQFAECSFSSAKLRLFLVTSKVLGKNVGMVIKKLALCIQHNTAQKASPPLFWIIDLVQDVIILSNKVTVALQPSTYILNGCCD